MTWAQLADAVCRRSWVHDRPQPDLHRSSSPGEAAKGGPRLVAVASGKGGVGKPTSV